MTITTKSTGKRSPPKPKGGGAERREEVLAAAMGLFAKVSVHEVTTRQIAALVGISQPTLYAYFPSKEAIAEELCARAFSVLERELQATLESATAATRLERLTRAYLRFARENPDAYRVAFMIEHKQSRVDEIPAGRPARLGMSSFDILRRAVIDRAGPGFSPGKAEALAQSLWANMHGLASLLIARPHFPWVAEARLVDTHVAGVLAAMKTAMKS